MSSKKAPPPDHLVPFSWLEKNGVTQEELANWIEKELAVKITIHGGAEFVSFSSHQKPVKFNEVGKLILAARSKIDA